MEHDTITEQIRQKTDIAVLVREYVPSLKKAGRVYKACCPFHKEKTPSFTVDNEKGFFYCFGCQAGGDIFEFVMKIEGLSFNEAGEKLARRAGLQWRAEKSFSPAEKERGEIRKAVECAKNFYHKCLLETAEGKTAREYLKTRSLDKAAAVKFELGYSPSGGTALIKFCAHAGFDADILVKAGLALKNYNGYRDTFVNRLMFPILNNRGEHCGFGARALKPGDEPKYLNSCDTPVFSKSRILYGLYENAKKIREKKQVLIVEGYMDVIGCTLAGADNCVAPLGTAFAATHAELIKRYTDEVCIVFDPDDAGRRAALRAGGILIQSGLYVKIAELDEKIDPDDYLKKHSLEKFLAVIDKARDLADYHFDFLRAGINGQLSPVDKTRMARELSETVSKQADPVIQQEWARKISSRLGVAQSVLASRQPFVPAVREQTADGGTAESFSGAEADILGWLMRFPQYHGICEEAKLNGLSPSAADFAQQIKILFEKGLAGADLARELCAVFPAKKDFIIKASVAELPEIFDPERDISNAAKNIENKFIKGKLLELKNLKRKLLEEKKDVSHILKEETKLYAKLKTR